MYKTVVFFTILRHHIKGQTYFPNFHTLLPNLPLFNEVSKILQCFLLSISNSAFSTKCDHQFM
ncbi:hypothetical protein Hanom_Chr12g01100201 [Helianthus anomalus]